MLRFLALLAGALAAYGATPVPSASWTVLRGSATADAAVKHANHPSLRVEPGGSAPDARIRFAPVSLTIGKRYELSGWIRTEGLEVHDLDRSPIAIGAALTMASMPFDVHSAALGGTQPWTRVTLRFVAGRADDQILLTVAEGGSFHGKAWFEGVSLDEISSQGDWPTREAVQTFGPAYRYPAAGWIYLHIQGAPYERGYQHGRLMAREIPEYLDRCAANLGSPDAWTHYRTTANALFLRGFDREILEEMRGIADGASDAGAKWQDRRIDLVDIVVANVTVELVELRAAVSTTATGLESLSFDKPAYADPKKRDSVTDHCSAFAATGPATRDGKMVIAHLTMWPLTLAEQTNVMLDIQPASGHRMLIQGYPGAIESGTDWYQNDAGVVLTETTIRQTPFDIQGTPVAFRARMAIQYGGNVDEVVKQLGTRNNGLYTNEWLIGDAKNNEIAMYELGTRRTRLWRSSRNQWFGNTPGFYWGDNNAKDLEVRLENYYDPKGTPDYIPYVPASRDLKWGELYQKYRGQIDEQFAFLAMRTAPLVSSSTMDAKVATGDMASRMMVWAAFGKPNQREWVAPRHGYEKNDGLFPSGYYLFSATPSASLRSEIEEKEKARLAATSEERKPAAQKASFRDRLWKGWILPSSDADNWLAGGAAAYHRVLAADDVDKALDAQRISYRGLKLGPENPSTRVRLATAQGVLFLDGLRHKIGDDAFFKLMSDFFAENTTKTVTADAFLKKAGVPFESSEPADGPAYLTGDIWGRLASAAIVYGTVREAGTNRYTAEQMQTHYLDGFESAVPIYKDFEASDDLLRHRDVVFIGRPEANSALAAWAEKLGLHFEGAQFSIDGAVHASERDGLVFAARNPLDPSHMVLVVAGNDALRTVKASRIDEDAAYALVK